MFQDLPLSVKNEFKKICFRMFSYQDDKLKEIAKSEGVEYAALLRDFIDYSIKMYEYRKGTLKSNGDKFFCQLCRKESLVRKKHVVKVGVDEFAFCESCFFSNAYKDFVRRFI